MKTMKTLDDFSKSKESVLHAYDKIIDSSLLPVGNIDQHKVLENREALVKERFYVAVCGQMKSGKSTLLNALVFQKRILPVDDTVMTAKNTLLEYGERPTLEIEYYDCKEWGIINDALKQNCQNKNDEIITYSKNGGEKTFDGDKNQSLQELKKECELTTQKYGIYKNEYIFEQRRVESVDGISNLHQFVTPVEKGGRYSPFVKQVTVRYPHPWLKLVTVADTPGINDPFRFREDVTKNWIHKAGAVLYVCYAGQAMAESDVKFFSEYLFHVSGSRRVIAVNKIDAVSDKQAVASYLQDLQNDKRVIVSRVFGDKKGICYTNALAAIISAMQENGEEFDAELQEYYSQFKKTGYLETDKHGLEELRSKVEERLVQNKGEDLISHHSDFIKKLCERKQQLIEVEAEQATKKREALDFTLEQRKAEKDKIDKQMEQCNSLVKEFGQQLNRDIDKQKSVLDEAVRTIIKELVKTMDAEFREITKQDKIKGIIRDTQWIIKEAIDNAKGAMTANGYVILKEVEKSVKNQITKLRISLDNIGITTAIAINPFLDLQIYELIASIRDDIVENFSREGIESFIDENTSWLQRFFNTEGGAEDSWKKIVRDVRNEVEANFLQGFTLSICARIKEQVLDVVKEVQEFINKSLKERQEYLQDIEDEVKNINNEKKRIDNEIHALKESGKVVEGLLKEVQTILSFGVTQEL